MKNSITVKELLKDYGVSLIAGILTAFGLHYFSQHSGFVPGGISGLAFIVSWFTPDLPRATGILMLLFNMPFIILVSIFVEKRLGLNLAFYILVQSSGLIVMENLPHFAVNDGNLIFACIGAGVLSGLGYGLQIRVNGSAGGTYAISALIKHWNPAANIAWLSYAMDCSVVFLVFSLGEFNISKPVTEPNAYQPEAIVATVATIINLFIANFVVDYCLQGSKSGYKFEIITNNPEELASEIMTDLKHGVTELNVQGMYTHSNKYMIVCIIRKRELSKMMKIMKKYEGTFASFSKVNEVIGLFKK